MHCAAKQGKKPRTLQRVKNTRAWTDDQFNTFSCFFSTTLVYLFLPPSTLGFTWVSAFRLQHNKRLVLSPPNTSRSELYSFHRRSETLIDQTESEFDTAKCGEVSKQAAKRKPHHDLLDSTNRPPEPPTTLFFQRARSSSFAFLGILSSLSILFPFLAGTRLRDIPPRLECLLFFLLLLWLWLLS